MMMRDTAHLWVLAVALVALGAGYAGARTVLVPDSFGAYGHYRGQALLDARAKPVNLPPRKTCYACHEKVWKGKDQSAHVKTHCAQCHGFGDQHLKDCEAQAQAAKAEGRDPGKIHCDKKGMDVPNLKATCGKCHQQMVGRPEKFPQIDLPAHLTEQEAEEPDSPNACKQCHDPHDPAEEPSGDDDSAADDEEE